MKHKPLPTSRTNATVALAMAMLLSTCSCLAAAATCSTRAPERFVDFLPAFTYTKRFALERTALPLPMLHWASGQGLKDIPDRSELPPTEYKRWPTLAEFMNDRELLSRVSEQTATSAAIELFKDDNPGLVTFRFRLKAGCWQLWQYEVRES